MKVVCFLLAIIIPFVVCDKSDFEAGKLERIVVHEAKISYTNKKEETARNFLQDYHSTNPVVLLVDNTKESNGNALRFINNVFRLTQNPPNFLLMKFNNSGVTEIIETTENNTNNFIKVLQKGMGPSSYLGIIDSNKTAVFFGILNAIQVLPKYSGIVVMVNRAAEDEVLAEQTLSYVKKNQIRLFVVWGGSSSDSRVLKEVVGLSRGKFYINSDRDLSAEYYEMFIDNADYFSNMSMVLSRRNLQGMQYLEFPVDSGVSGIHISISPNITGGELRTPRGYKIDVLEGEEVALYTQGSFLVQDVQSGVHEVHLNTTLATSQDVGVWRLHVSNARVSYNVTVFVYSELTTVALILDDADTNSTEKVVSLSVTGEVSEVQSVTFLDENGQTVNYWQHDLAAYHEENIRGQNVELLLKTPKTPHYVLVNGSDGKGHNFSRLSYVRQYDDGTIFKLPPLTVDVGLSSELITQANRQPQIFFEVTNNGNKAVFVRFTCTDEKAILLSMSPWSTWISPQETTTVRITLNTRTGSYQDTLTFNAIGAESVEKKVIVDVGTAVASDNTDPTLDYKYTSDCTGLLIGDCRDGTWTIEVKARDTGSGLLQVSSQPKGLHFPYGFSAGSKEEVTGYYSGSCCEPDLQLTAVDRQNNRRILNVNSYRATLGTGSITAIILGVLFLIVLIILLVYLIKKCCCTKDSFDLPVYKGRMKY